MKVVQGRLGWLVAAMFIASSLAYGQQATDYGQATPQTGQQGQDANQQQDLQAAPPLDPYDTQPNGLDQPDGLDTQQGQLEPPREYDQSGQIGQPGAQQRQPMRQPGEPGMAGQGEPGVLGVMIVESAGPGVMIREVVGGSAAAAAGLQPGDVILEINGQGMDSPLQVTQMIRTTPAGQAVTLTVWRDGQEQQIPATLQAAQRDPYRVNFRGGEGSMNGDATARIARLESQLAAVMQELQRLRQEVTQLRAGGAGQPSGATGFDALQQPDATQPGLEPLDTTQPGLEEPGATQPGLEEPATQPGLEEEPAQPETTEEEPALPF